MYVFVLVTHKKVYTREKQMNYQKFFLPSFNEFSQLTIASETNNTKSDHNKTIQRVTTKYHRMPLCAGNSQLIHIQHSYPVSTPRKITQAHRKMEHTNQDGLFSRGFHVFEVNNITSWWLI